MRGEVRVYDITQSTSVPIQELVFGGEIIRYFDHGVCHPTNPNILVCKRLDNCDDAAAIPTTQKIVQRICFIDMSTMSIIKTLSTASSNISDIQFFPNGNTMVTHEKQGVTIMHLPPTFLTSSTASATDLSGMRVSTYGVDGKHEIEGVFLFSDNMRMLLFLYDGNPGVLETTTLILGTTKWKDRTHRFYDDAFRHKVFNFMCVMEFMRTATEQQKQQQGIKYKSSHCPWSSI